ncbi:MAG: 50S ribosomal protein L24e [Candidatus Altiarchaeum hamiconexum]|uniref:50S ribosomal protein L24e n=1 Tax=Candidatus Altarchaeum hamiconexum TaxID=1803513 RepID=A0A8J8CED0_9ARCH|nr:50S ribosomal protein L24e [Candidatus Altarchaeum hamiconexum]OIQ05886.1 MAG: hypothetical protein AUK59_02155 [Candidatus Altarchaeum sp. CG2_30_32_3053]PIN66954.1 MAG: 50S ribosomal protein L24e [Candidatus Altarchaeum sp. CG12_big_fil_rev_8_21_14_0_65_33_22]PIV27888.1 MAG: 50S ribosomal protein L24e [Candidatus Altarchaeum sp. CG03_land_8_20_14_0_80_32_618]PIX48356.1 MAG: 50S ribosomal protein L24e [Candidatus Altarchaeum sp. CG_4_8_14_3_um_filter_33_2054]PIZ29230.1 MAG: 50S ribosomal p
MKCSFCGKEIKKGTGLLFVMLSGRGVNYCSSKCRKNVEMGRKQRKVEWTEQYINEKKARIKQ